MTTTPCGDPSNWTTDELRHHLQRIEAGEHAACTCGRALIALLALQDALPPWPVHGGADAVMAGVVFVDAAGVGYVGVPRRTSAPCPHPCTWLRVPRALVDSLRLSEEEDTTAIRVPTCVDAWRRQGGDRSWAISLMDYRGEIKRLGGAVDATAAEEVARREADKRGIPARIYDEHGELLGTHVPTKRDE